MNHNVAIDGPSGAGKSTIAQIVAENLGLLYIDTGAMYRAMGLHFKAAEKWPETPEERNALAETADIMLSHENGVQQILLNGRNVSALIRTEECGMLASKVSAYPEVRVRMVAIQQQIAKKTDVVMDGRDIGTVVIPDAFLKVFLTANVKERAIRRYLQMQEKGDPSDIRQIEEDLNRRDLQDSTRETSPLKQADDAVLLDSTYLSIEEVARKILELYREKTGEAS